MRFKEFCVLVAVLIIFGIFLGIVYHIGHIH
jgi:hypothetical protein